MKDVAQGRYPKVRLASFAAGKFSERARSFVTSAQGFDAFETCKVYAAEDLEPDFRKKHAEMLSPNVRGFGYYIWKPHIVLQQLLASEDGDVIAYVDVGCDFNPLAIERFMEYVSLCESSRSGVLAFSQVFIEAHWTKMDLPLRLGLPREHAHLKTSQLLSGIVFFRKCKSVLKLVRDWGLIAVERNYHFVDDSASDSPNHPHFKEHRHDQSIFSLLAKELGAITTFGEAVLPHRDAFPEMHEGIPVVARRLRQ